jgi:hypothetical protein
MEIWEFTDVYHFDQCIDKRITGKATCLLFVGLRDRPPENDGRVNAKSGVIRKGSVL